MADISAETQPTPDSFEHLAAARRDWIETVLRPWCRKSPLKELRKAELEWFDIAGRADVNPTLWTWAWERFPEIVHPDLPGVDETSELLLTLLDGSQISGFPDGRRSQRGMLILIGVSESGESLTHGPLSLDQITSIQRL